MWTPKRVLLLSTGVAVFLAGYVIYAFFLGGIDGLPPLPQGYLAGSGVPSAWTAPTDSDIDRKLQDAFGKQCPQINKSIKFEIRSRNMVVAAAEASFKEPDGRVKLRDLSVARFKDHGDGNFAEITTITSDLAFLSFEQRIESPTDMSKGKVTGGELRGNILLTSNHRTPQPSDDLEVFVQNAPLYYEERAGKIWTDGVVRLIDKQTQPHPTKIDGQGMELYLAKASASDKKPAAPQPAGKAKQDLTDVERIILKSSVVMHLYSDANAGFMAGAHKAAPRDAGQKPAEKSHIIITTYGPFVYDVVKDVARFESPPATPDRHFPDQVHVLREPLREGTKQKVPEWQDNLFCDDLTLKFRRRQSPPGAAKADPSRNDREIETAYASARAGNDVALSLESQSLKAYCTELIYQCATGDRGARTELRGERMEAHQEAHRIKAKKLELEAANQKGVGQRIIAYGPGQVDLFNPNPGKGYTTHAFWKGLLTSTTSNDGPREFDVLTFTDDAAFIDDEHKQKLFGQHLEVWLQQADSPDKATPVGPKPNTLAGGSRQQPWKVEAYKQVKAESPDFRVADCHSLTIRFHNVARSNPLLPSAVQPPLTAPSLVAPKSANVPPPSSAGAGLIANKDKEKPKRPIDLRAKKVVVDVLRSPEKNDLQELLAEGSVHVRQDPEKQGDKGVDIKGETLKLLHFDQGDNLQVYGDARGSAVLQLGELYLVASKVEIDQRINEVHAEGSGAMLLPSNTTFEGARPTKPGTRLTVEWNRGMIFNGRDAEFNGGVVAYQDESTLQCEQLQVALDRTVSLREGQKSESPAKVEKVIAHNRVIVSDKSKDKTEQVIGRRELDCQTLVVDRLDDKNIASGPGMVARIQFETGEEFGTTNARQPSPKDPPKIPRLMLLRVNFQDQMLSMLAPSGKRTSTFHGNIMVWHVPVDSMDRLDVPVDANRLPKNALVIQCERLLAVEQILEGKKSQSMEATTNVKCWTGEYTIVASKVTFDQARDVVVFNGVPGNPAVVWRNAGGVVGGSKPATQGQNILYDRRSGNLTADGITVITGELPTKDRLPPTAHHVVASLTGFGHFTGWGRFLKNELPSYRLHPPVWQSPRFPFESPLITVKGLALS